MLNFDCGVKGVPTINLTKDEVEVRYLPHKGNIAEDPENDMEMSTAVPGPTTHQPTTHAGSSSSSCRPATVLPSANLETGGSNVKREQDSNTHEGWNSGGLNSLQCTYLPG